MQMWRDLEPELGRASQFDRVVRGRIFRWFVTEAIESMGSEHHGGYVGTDEDLALSLEKMVGVWELRKGFLSAFRRLQEGGAIRLLGFTTNGRPVYGLMRKPDRRF